MLVLPTTEAVSEHSSALRPVIGPTFVQTSEARLNHLMLLHLHNDLANSVDIMEVANFFAGDCP